MFIFFPFLLYFGSTYSCIIGSVRGSSLIIKVEAFSHPSSFQLHHNYLLQNSLHSALAPFVPTVPPSPLAPLSSLKSPPSSLPRLFPTSAWSSSSLLVLNAKRPNKSNSNSSKESTYGISNNAKKSNPFKFFNVGGGGAKQSNRSSTSSASPSKPPKQTKQSKQSIEPKSTFESKVPNYDVDDDVTSDPNDDTPLDFSNLSSTDFSRLSRRQLGQLTELAIATLGLGTTYLGTRESSPQEYGLWGILPVGPYKTKPTIMETIVDPKLDRDGNGIWTFDQKFGILNVQVPLRMTVVKLNEGGLFVYNPIAATPQLLSLLRPLIDAYGPIRHVVLGSVALEHKVYAGVFAQKFPKAQVWTVEGQYSFPEDLPLEFLGFPVGRTKKIPRRGDSNSSSGSSSSSGGSDDGDGIPPEWSDEFEFRTLGPFISRDGAFSEAVFFHKPTSTLLVTDTVVEVSSEVPNIYYGDVKPLLYHARDTVTDRIGNVVTEALDEIALRGGEGGAEEEAVDDILKSNEKVKEVLEKGWRRVVLFGLFFTPGAIVIKDANTALAERRPDINPDFLGIYPWDWIGDDVASFRALQGERRGGKGGGLLVAPILQQLILNRNPVEVLDFAEEVGRWPIQRIIPAHLKNNLQYTGKDYRSAFSFLEAKGVPKGSPKPLDIDMQTLRDAEIDLLESGAIAKCPPLPGGKVSREEILRHTVYGCRAGVCSPRST